MTNAHEGMKEQQTRGGEEVVFIAHLKGTKWRLTMARASVPCHSSLHNITMWEGAQTQQKKAQWTRNQTKNEACE
jgi:hypothetical protein